MPYYYNNPNMYCSDTDESEQSYEDGLSDMEYDSNFDDYDDYDLNSIHEPIGLFGERSKFETRRFPRKSGWRRRPLSVS